jgi:hypothetical protein
MRLTIISLVLTLLLVSVDHLYPLVGLCEILQAYSIKRHLHANDVDFEPMGQLIRKV